MAEYATLGHRAPAISVCFVLHFLCCSAVDGVKDHYDAATSGVKTAIV